jgi:hypothetical protein
MGKFLILIASQIEFKILAWQHFGIKLIKPKVPTAGRLSN